MNKHRAFVSSTFIDLEKHRKVAIDVLRNGGIDVEAMEDRHAEPVTPHKFCLDGVGKCDLLILLVARRRGFIPAGQTRSITQLEYDYARKHHIDVLPFLLDDKADWPAQFDESADAADWRAEIMKQGRGLFGADPQSLAATLNASILRWKDRQHEKAHLHQYLKNLEQEFGVIRILGVPNYSPDVKRAVPIDSLCRSMSAYAVKG